jgi:SAM-dependent methyltransferase
MKFNMGCGANKRAGFVNVDAEAAFAPDEVWDLERTPWPWPDNCADEVLFIHSLEHMGADAKVFLAIMCELYRILAPGGEARIHVPHPRHDNFMNDPTHVRAITPTMLTLFDREQNDRWIAMGAANSPLAHYTGVDFRIVEARTIISEPYASRFQAGEITAEQVQELLGQCNNVAAEFQILLAARKPGP